MVIGDPNRFDGPVRVQATGADDRTEVPFVTDATIGRGIGLADLVEAIRLDRPARASADFAAHILDVLLSIEEAAASGQPMAVASRTERPAPLPRSVG